MKGGGGVRIRSKENAPRFNKYKAKGGEGSKIQGRGGSGIRVKEGGGGKRKYEGGETNKS